MWREFESLVESSMKEWKIPGLALAVIEDGEVSLLKGYGVRLSLIHISEPTRPY